MMSLPLPSFQLPKLPAQPPRGNDIIVCGSAADGGKGEAPP